MTGLDPKEDRILEVAAIATDWDFKEIARFEAVQKVDIKLIQRRMVGEFWEKFPEVREQLMAQNESGEAANRVENELMSFVGKNFEDEKLVLLAGNSIHQDRKFIEREWKNFVS
jgi:oligoribonuclease